MPFVSWPDARWCRPRAFLSSIGPADGRGAAYSQGTAPPMAGVAVGVVPVAAPFLEDLCPRGPKAKDQKHGDAGWTPGATDGRGRRSMWVKGLRRVGRTGMQKGAVGA